MRLAPGHSILAAMHGLGQTSLDTIDVELQRHGLRLGRTALRAVATSDDYHHVSDDVPSATTGQSRSGGCRHSE